MQFIFDKAKQSPESNGSGVDINKGRRPYTTMQDTTSRPVDSLGRIVIPRELRESFDLNEGDFVEISVSDDAIVLKKSAS